MILKFYWMNTINPDSIFIKCFLVFLFISCYSLVFHSCKVDSESIKRKKFITGGRKIYNARCANCHGENGKGLSRLYPPLANSDYLKKKQDVICLTKNGLNDSVYVNGELYNREMPANNDLNAIDIAYVLTYIYSKWGNKSNSNKDKVIEVKEVKQALKHCDH